MYIPLFINAFIHSLTDTMSALSFWLLIIMLLIWMYKYLFESLLLLPLGVKLIHTYLHTLKRWNFLDHGIIMFLIFWGTAIPFSIVTAPVNITLSNTLEFRLIHILANTCYFLLFLFDGSHPNECEMVSHCDLDVHFFNLLGRCMSSLEKCLFKFFVHF